MILVSARLRINRSIFAALSEGRGNGVIIPDLEGYHAY